METLGEETLEELKIIENKPSEEDRGNDRNSHLIGVEAGQEVDNFQVILGGMTEAILGKDHVQEEVPIETKLDISSVGNMIILLRIVET